MVSPTYKLKWLKQLLKEQRFGCVSWMMLIVDNQAINLSNPAFHEIVENTLR